MRARRVLATVKSIPLMGWISMIVFSAVLLLLVLGSFTQLAQAESPLGLEVLTLSSLSQTDSVGNPSQSSRALNPMTLLIFTFLITVFLGVELLTKVPSQLHTPLMSGSNAISGITVVGACLAAGQGRESILLVVIGVIAMICAMINVAGGYLVTDRMLRMFKGKERK